VDPPSERAGPLRSLREPATLLSFVERLKEGIYISNVAGALLDANPAMVEISGCATLEELRELGTRGLFAHPEDRERELELLARSGEVREFEFEMRRADGETRTVLDTCYRVIDPVGGEVLFHGILVDITQRKHLERRLRELAGRDALTGCNNRHFLVELAPRLEQRTEPWAVLVLDVDRFKEYNDRWGHAVGDAVLRWVARFLLQQVRVEDFVVRLGGDEFAVLLTGQSSASAEALAERLSLSAEEAGLPVSLSVGWSSREGAESLEETIRRADLRLLERRGRERGIESPHEEGGAVLERLLLG
jgi:diguanylate cyclase (GGDEF)-like protein/PAS domain S-box-containing protein